ncbi:MAG TPA: hypothetical protein VGH88_20545 [Streptosporangiaceae bacterium]|jgi:hypothetical protein
MTLAARLAGTGRSSGWFSTVIVETGRLPLFCFFVAFLVSFLLIRLSVRMIRAQVSWWPGNVTRGDMHLHHMVFGVIFMVVAGVAGLAVPVHSLGWRAGTAAAFGVGTALVLDEFALILHLRDVYWTSAGRVSIDAVFIAAGLTALLLLGVVPAGIHDVAVFLGKTSDSTALGSLLGTLAVLFTLALVTLLKGKIWTGLFGLVLPFLFLIGAVRLARPGSPWSRWRYRAKPKKAARAVRREERVRQPVIRVKTRLVDLVAGYHDMPPLPARPARLDPPAPPARDPDGTASHKTHHPT